MRFSLRSTERARKVAKRLRAQLSGDGLDLTQSQALEAAARIYGYRDWQELAASAGREGPGLDDAECEPEVAAARRVQHVAVLAALGLSPERAEAVVDVLHPTRSIRPRTLAEIAHVISDVLMAHGGDTLRIDPWRGGRLVLVRVEGVFREISPWDDRTLAEITAALAPTGASVGYRIEPEPPHPWVGVLRTQYTATPGAPGFFWMSRRVRGYVPITPTDAPPWTRGAAGGTDACVRLSFADTLDSLGGLRRDAWVPRDLRPVADGEGTQYYGRPWLPERTAWPTAPDGTPLDFVMQVSPGDIPHEAHRAFGNDTFVSLFVHPATGFARILRVAPWQSDGGPAEHPSGPAARIHPAMAPTRYEKVADFPCRGDDALGHGLPLDAALCETMECLRGMAGGPSAVPGIGEGVGGSGADSRALAAILSRAYGERVGDGDLQRFRTLGCRSGDKIGGWPRWGDAPWWPVRRGCPKVPLFQVDHTDPIHAAAGFLRGSGHVFMDFLTRDCEFVWDLGGRGAQP